MVAGKDLSFGVLMTKGSDFIKIDNVETSDHLEKDSSNYEYPTRTLSNKGSMSLKSLCSMPGYIAPKIGSYLI